MTTTTRSDSIIVRSHSGSEDIVTICFTIRMQQ